MTPEEYTTAQAALATAETEKAALDQQRRDCIDRARELNEQTRACTRKMTAIDQSTAPVRVLVAEYIAEKKRLAAEEAKG